jgi:hypothetical protein
MGGSLLLACNSNDRPMGTGLPWLLALESARMVCRLRLKIIENHLFIAAYS